MRNFEDFFIRLFGFEPYRWQSEVAEQMSSGVYADVHLLPGAGKTYLMPIWYWNLLNDLDKNVQRTVPLRYYHIINRKLLVDSVCNIARHMIQRLNEDEFKYEQELVEEKLGCQPLAIGRMRGGLSRIKKEQVVGFKNGRLMLSPIQPTIITTTAYQLGSRILMRGYDSSPEISSIHAGLISHDSLLVLDEVQMVGPFCETLKIIANYCNPKFRPYKAVAMSATKKIGETYKVSEIDNNEKIKRIANSIKKVNLDCVLSNGDFIKKAKRLVKDQQKQGKKLICVIVNKVGLARKLYENIPNSKLLTSRIRNHERDRNFKKIVKKILAGWRDKEEQTPLVLVATQVVESGVDFDFDCIISQCCPLDCLVQRFGRQDREGLLGKSKGYSEGYIIHIDANDPVYGETTRRTYDFLAKQANNKVIDNFKFEDIDISLCEESNKIVKLTEPIIDCLAHNYNSTPINIEAYLNGVSLKNDADFYLVYRKEISQSMIDDGNGTALEWVKMARPIRKEMLGIPVGVIYNPEEASDSALVEQQDDGRVNDIFKSPCIVIRNGKPRFGYFSDVKAADIVVVPQGFGRHDRYGWNPNSQKKVSDVYDRWANVLRLHPKFMPPAFDISAFKEDEEYDGEKVLKYLKDNIDDWIVAYPKRKNSLNNLKCKILNNYWNVDNPKVTPDRKGIFLYPSKNFESNVQTLDFHTSQVRRYAESYASILLGDKLGGLYGVAAEFHDAGKACYEFRQRTYPSGIPKDIILAKPLVAPKSYIRFWRHELQSVSLMAENGITSDVDTNLLYHIVATHHGRNRGFILPVSTDFKKFVYKGYKSTCNYVDNMEDTKKYLIHFLELSKRYSIWGLTYLEAIFRLADWRGSTIKEDIKWK